MLSLVQPSSWAPYTEHQLWPYLTMAWQYKKVEILGLPVFDPAPEALRLNCIPSTHKASDMVISLLWIAHKAKIVPCTTLTDLHYCFMSDLWLRQWAQGNGCPCLDSEGRAITCDNMVLHRTIATLQVSPYSTETILQDKVFKRWLMDLFGNWTTRLLAIPAMASAQLLPAHMGHLPAMALPAFRLPTPSNPKPLPCLYITTRQIPWAPASHLLYQGTGTYEACVANIEDCI